MFLSSLATKLFNGCYGCVLCEDLRRAEVLLHDIKCEMHHSDIVLCEFRNVLLVLFVALMKAKLPC